MLFKDLKEGQHFRVGPMIAEKIEENSWPMRKLFPISLKARLEIDPSLTPDTMITVNADSIAPKFTALYFAPDTDVLPIPLEHTQAREDADRAYRAELVARAVKRDRAKMAGLKAAGLT